MSADKERIAELEQFVNLIAPLGVIECAGCRKPTPVIEEGVDHICQTCKIEGLKRKLAEQQAVILKLLPQYGDVGTRDVDVADLRKAYESPVELNNLLAKAKEEMREEFLQDAERYRWVRDHCTHAENPQHTWIVEAPGSEWDDAIDSAMIAAPKPQGMPYEATCVFDDKTVVKRGMYFPFEPKPQGE